jgi:hypothetical protein
MDAHRFDALSKALRGSLTRRGALAGIAGGLLGELLGQAPTAAARCAKAGQKPQGSRKRCCPGLAKGPEGRCIRIPCPFNQVPNPVTGECGCPPGTDLCEGGCGPGGPGAGYCFTHNCPGEFDPQSCSCQCAPPRSGSHGICDPNGNVYATACCLSGRPGYACLTLEGTAIAGCCETIEACPPPEAGVCV